MSDEEKINDSPEESSDSSENIPMSIEPEVVNENQPFDTSTPEIKNMEVHHHPDLHHKPKKWKEYFLEFLMIFLAVTLGFIAENIREHITEKEKLKQSIESLINSVRSDTVQLSNILASNKTALIYLDKLVKLKDSSLTTSINKNNFYLYITNGAFNDVYFKPNVAAFEQLQSSGALRLINKLNIIDSIFKYQQNNSFILRQEPDNYFFFKNVWDGVSKLTDMSFLRDSTKTIVDYEVVGATFHSPNELPLYYDKKTADQLFNNVSALALATEIYSNLLQQQLIYGNHLISILKSEYHIE